MAYILTMTLKTITISLGINQKNDWQYTRHAMFEAPGKKKLSPMGS